MDEAARSIDGDDAVALAALDDHQRAVQGRARLGARLRQRGEAIELRALAELGDIAAKRQAIHGGDLHLHLRSVAAELALAVHVSDATVQSRIARGRRLVHDWPTWLDAFEDGRIGTDHMRALERAGEPIRDTPHVSAELRERFAAEMLDLAVDTTPGRLEREAGNEADRLIAEPLTIRHQQARQDRTLWITDEQDGMSALGIRLPSVQAHGIRSRMLQIAKHKPEGDDRTIPNVMADTAAEMLLTAPGTLTIPGSESITATVRVTMPATNLVETGYDESAEAVEPAILDGAVVIDAQTARDLAGQTSTWLRLFVAPFGGFPVGTDAYTPTAAQRRWLQVRDGCCGMPGCDRPAWECDLDHTDAHCDGGPTEVDNLAHLCRRHHMLKHHLPGTTHAWQVEQIASGTLRWTTPLGEVYVDRPMPVWPRRRRRQLTQAGDRAPTPPSSPPSPPRPPPF